MSKGWADLQSRIHARNQKAKIMEVMETQHEPAVSQQMLIQETELSRATVRKYCNQLKEDGILERGKLSDGPHPQSIYWWVDL